MNQLLDVFKKTAILEGISSIILFFIAMPLKYWADMPLAVKYTGWVHGVLFVLYMGLLLGCWIKYNWKWSRVALFTFASLIPFAPFYVERQLK